MIGIQYGWDDAENTVIRMYVGEYWDWEDLDQAITGMCQLMHEIDHQVDVVTIMRPTTDLPGGNATHYLKQAIIRLPRNAGTHVMIGGNIHANRALKMLARNYSCMTGRLFQTNSLGEAYRIIARNRPEIYECYELVA